MNLKFDFCNDSHNIFFQASQDLKNRFLHEGLSKQVIKNIQECVWEFYSTNRRAFPWREKIIPYHVVVSEVMLQQTQTYRVEPKFTAFIERFSNFESLATAPFDEVLRYWKGLGYNRRAQNLQRIAQVLHNEHAGQVPREPSILQKLPGLGAATAASIATFTHNIPHVFLETNIRTVLIYFFFDTAQSIHDRELYPFAEKLLDRSNPREWCYALMDIGVMLKKHIGNLNRLSNSYTKQSSFEGSRRQIRGKILELLLTHSSIGVEELKQKIADPQNRTASVVEELIKENFIKNSKGILSLRK